MPPNNTVDYDLDCRDPQAEEKNACGWYRCRGICGLGKKEPELCSHHEARDDRTSPIIIEEPTYNKIDKAAIAAAKIISHCRKQKDDCEYGIGIYERVVQGEKWFYLVETRKGKDGELRVSNDNNLGGGQYRFAAHVHSHPLYASSQKFSTHDYIASYGGEGGILPTGEFSVKAYKQYVIYLVATERNADGDKNELIKFNPPYPRVEITNHLRGIWNQSVVEDVKSDNVGSYLTVSDDAVSAGGYQKTIMTDVDSETL